MSELDISAIIKDPSIFSDITAIAKTALDAEKERQRLIPVAEPVFIENKIANRLSEANKIVPVNPGQTIEGDMIDIIQANNDESKWNEMRMCFTMAFEDRIAFESTKEDCTNQMIDNLISVSKEFTSDRVCRSFVALGIDASFVNRNSSKFSRFNVYALQKVAEIVKAMTGLHIRTATIRCFLKSLFACRVAEVPFTKQLQLAALSKDIRISKSHDALLTRHTLSKATAAAQRSQMIVTLEGLNMLASNNMKGDKNVITLKDTPATRQLIKMID